MWPVQPSTRYGKKWMVTFDTGKKVHFGCHGYEDFTEHKDTVRQQQYLNRHWKHEDWSDWTTPGFLSRWLLWNKPTIRGAIKDTNARFKTRFRLSV
jgi:hypothetical protein